MSEPIVKPCRDCITLGRRCPECRRRAHNAWSRRWAKNNPRKKADYMKTYRAKLGFDMRQATPENKLKRSAQEKLQRGVRDGVVIKPSICSACGSVGRIEGHHRNYHKPLEVIWLCSLCHKKEHRENGHLILV